MDKDLEKLLSNTDRSKFENSPFMERIEKPWGYEIHFTPYDLPYAGKIIHLNAGKRLSLQFHDKKVESWCLLKGSAKMIKENARGEWSEVEMQKEVGYKNEIGQKHRLVGITDADVLEVSTPEIGNTYRLEDDYSRPTETENVRRQPNRGWSP